MQTLKAINKFVIFLLEVSMLLALGYWGFHSFKTLLLQYLFGIGTPVLAAVLWGIFAAPKSEQQLRLPYRVAFSIVMFCASGCLLYQSGATGYAITLMIVAVLTESLALVLERDTAIGA
ncbi:YrdB family protein [Mucilaginibacter sp. AW1-3]